MILIGSRALSLQYKEDFRDVSKSDYDFIMSKESFQYWFEKYKKNIKSIYPTSDNKIKSIVSSNGKLRSYEIELDDNKANSFIIDNVSELVAYGLEGEGFLGEKCLVMSIDSLYLLKKSHINYPVHFEKNIMDYHFMKNKINSSNLENPILKEFYLLKSDEASVRYSKYRTPKLNVSNSAFFEKSGVANGRVYIHDDLHEVVKHYDSPIYEMLKDDMDSAWCEKDKFESLSLPLKIQCVQEEAYVIALERYYIPKVGKFNSPFWCYERALRRICTTLCSGYFRDFAIENYTTIINSYETVFLKKFNKAFKDGSLVPMDFIDQGLLDEDGRLK